MFYLEYNWMNENVEKAQDSNKDNIFMASHK